MATEIQRTDVGFAGGQTLALRLAEGGYDALVKALGDDKAGRWHTIELEESTVLVDLSQIVYVQRETGNAKVGF